MNHCGKPSRSPHDWLVLLATTKPRMATGDPELFACLHELTLASREVVAAHGDHLADQVARIVTDGIASGEFAAGDAARVGHAVLHATAFSTTPRTPPNWGDSAVLAGELEAVCALLLRGLAVRDRPALP